MLTLMLVWLAVGIGMMLIGTGRSSAGMPLAYFLGLSLIHAPGAMIYLEAADWDPIAVRTREGFEQTVIGMVAFLIAVIIARVTVFGWRADGQPRVRQRRDLAVWDRLSRFYLVGGCSWFVLTPFIGAIPSVSSVIASLSLLLVVGTSLRLWVARKSRNLRKFWVTIALLPLLPLLTVIREGFLGAGMYWVLAVISFIVAQSKQRISYLLFAPAAVFVGLSLFVNYMAAREDLRRLVWSQQAEVGDRMQRIVKIFEDFEWLDSSNSRQRFVIDGRLNQNWLVGAAVERLESGAVGFAHGATIGDMFLGLIPRALWPEKPMVGGGASVVRDFTGLQFAEGTSVGAGQVLEFYVNFGRWGVIGGFFLYGWLIGRLDVGIVECLNRADHRGFLLRFMLCMAMIQPGGNLLEVVTTAASSTVAAYGISYFLERIVSSRAPADHPSPKLSVHPPS
jgi:hypothetical protein